MHSWFAALLVMIGACQMSIGCSDAAGDTDGTSQTRYVMFFDLSDSPTLQDRKRWVSLAETQIIRRLRPGDAIEIYGLHDRTADAAALFADSGVAAGYDAGLEDLAAARRSVGNMRRGATAAVQDVLSSTVRARATDLFGAFDRVRADPARRTVLIFFSDMLHADKDLNLERTKIDLASLQTLVQPIAERRRWRPDLLEGVTVICVLPSPSPGAKRLANDRTVLREFHEVLFASLGARLVAFDSDLRASDLGLGDKK